MNRLARRIRMGSVAGGGGGGGGGPSVVSTTSFNTAFGANRVVTLARSPASGNTLIVMIKIGTSSLSGVTDNQGNTYTQDLDGSSAHARYIYRSSNITNAPTTLNLTNVADNVTVKVLEVNGLNATSPVSVAGGETLVSTSSSTISRSHTTLVANELVVGYLVQSAGTVGVSNAPSGMVNIPTFGSAADQEVAYYYLATSAGALTLTQNVTTSVANMLLSSISYKP